MDYENKYIINLFKIVFNLPFELFEFIIGDVKTLLNLEIYALYKSRLHLPIIQKKKEKFQLNCLYSFCLNRNYPSALIQINSVVKPFTLQKRIKILLEAKSLLGYYSFLELPEQSNIRDYFYEKYFKIILFSMILCDHWEKIIKACSHMCCIVEAYEVISNLSSQRKQLVIDHLDPEVNFLLILLLQKVSLTNSDIQKIKNLTQKEQLLTKLHIDVRVPIVEAFIYFFQKDPRLDEPYFPYETKREFLNTYIRRYNGRSIMFPEFKPDYFLYKVRGTPAEHGRALLNQLRSWYPSDNEGASPEGKWLDNFKLSVGIEYAFILSAQAPSILKKYFRNMTFGNRIPYHYDEMLDIFDYQENIPEILRVYQKFFKVYPSKKFMLEEFGIKL